MVACCSFQLSALPLTLNNLRLQYLAPAEIISGFSSGNGCGDYKNKIINVTFNSMLINSGTRTAFGFMFLWALDKAGNYSTIKFLLTVTTKQPLQTHLPVALSNREMLAKMFSLFLLCAIWFAVVCAHPVYVPSTRGRKCLQGYAPVSFRNNVICRRKYFWGKYKIFLNVQGAFFNSENNSFYIILIIIRFLSWSKEFWRMETKPKAIEE